MNDGAHDDRSPAADQAASARRRVLIVAYHFPPQAGSSGMQRTLRFVQNLPRFGWQPIVLTIAPHAYESVQPESLAEVQSDVVVVRAFGLDAARHMSWRGRYPAWLARPDRWMSWWPDAVVQGWRLIGRHRPAALFSTFPIATAHEIGYTLARRGLPWVADFRDPMAQDDYPNDVRIRLHYHRLERRVAARAAACTFTTQGAAAQFGARHVGSAAALEVIENGYDESAFASALDRRPSAPLNPGALTLLHSGIVYASERDPTQLFAALAQLKAGGIGGERLRIRFRAPMHEGLRQLANASGCEDMIEVAPPLGYAQALGEMMVADGLLVMQASNSNRQVPAKLYEYMRARRPIVALTDPAGDTAGVLRAAGIVHAARLDQAAEIVAVLERFMAGNVVGLIAHEAAISAATRLNRTRELARVLDRIAVRRAERMTGHD